MALGILVAHMLTALVKACRAVQLVALGILDTQELNALVKMDRAVGILLAHELTALDRLPGGSGARG
eukprot:3436019-Prymnesium_polylepis.1